VNELMDSDKVNRWLTLGANLGVLAGIILILFELNQNADLMRSQIIQNRGELMETGYRQVQHSDYWPAILAKRDAAESRSKWVETLTPEEIVRVRLSLLGNLASITSQYYQYQQGYLDEAVWAESTRDQIVRTLRDMPYFLTDASSSLRPDLVRELNRIADEEGLPPIGGSGSLD
jgi:hypothetical protein